MLTIRRAAVALLLVSSRLDLARAVDYTWAGDGSNAKWDYFVQGNPLDPLSPSGYLNWDPSPTLPTPADDVRFSGSFDSGRSIDMHGSRGVATATIDTPGAFSLGADNEQLQITGGLLRDATGVSNPTSTYAHEIAAHVDLHTPASTIDVTGRGLLGLSGGISGIDVAKTGGGVLEVGVTGSGIGRTLTGQSEINSLAVTFGTAGLGNVTIKEPSGIGLFVEEGASVQVWGNTSTHNASGPAAGPGVGNGVIDVEAGGFLQTEVLERRLKVIVDKGGVASLPAMGAQTSAEVFGAAYVGGLASDHLVTVEGGGKIVLVAPSFSGARVAFSPAAGLDSTIDLNASSLVDADLSQTGTPASASIIVGGGGTLAGVTSSGLKRVQVLASTLAVNLTTNGGGFDTQELDLVDGNYRAVRSESSSAVVNVSGGGVIDVPASISSPLSLVRLDGNDAPGAAKFTKLGGGALELREHGSFAGVVDVVGGTLVVGTLAPAGGASESRFADVFVHKSATARFAGVNATAASTRLAIEAPSVASPVGGRVEVVGDQQFANIELGGTLADAAAGGATLRGPIKVGAAFGGTFDVAAGGALTIEGPIAASTGAITKVGPGTLILPTSNGASGGLVVRGGRVQVGAEAALGQAPAFPVPGFVQLDGGGLTLPGSFRANANRGIVLGAGGGVFDVANFQTVVLAGRVEGAGALAKVGPGTLVLGGAYDAAGGVDLEQGVLQIGEAAAPSPVTIHGHVVVAPGASLTQATSVKFDGLVYLDSGLFAGSQTAEFAGVLAGNGSVNSFGAGQIVVSGQVSPGHSVGRLFASGSISLLGEILAEIAGADSSHYDQLVVNGSAMLGGKLTIMLAGGFRPHAGDSFQIISATRLSGQFSSYNLPQLRPGLDWNTSQLDASGVIRIVPEPAAALLMAAAIVFARLGCRRSLKPRSGATDSAGTAWSRTGAARCDRRVS